MMRNISWHSSQPRAHLIKIIVYTVLTLGLPRETVNAGDAATVEKIPDQMAGRKVLEYGPSTKDGPHGKRPRQKFGVCQCILPATWSAL